MTNEIAPLTDTQAPPAAQELFGMIQQKFGMVPNLFRVLGHHPAVLTGFLQLYEAIQHDLSARWREMAYLGASSINHCSYCMHYHRPARAGRTRNRRSRQGRYLAF
jgi:AhpD family alkylhydroperoxidase